MGRETEPLHHAEKNKFLNRLDESFGFLCAHISIDLMLYFSLSLPLDPGSIPSSQHNKARYFNPMEQSSARSTCDIDAISPDISLYYG